MADFTLTDAEARLAVATEQAEEISFCEGNADTGDGMVVIRAEALRRMLLNLPVVIEGVKRSIELRGPGVRITGAYIEGSLELDNACATTGDPLPRLSMIECYIPQMISLSAAKLRGLCLKNSRITYLRANNTVIGTQLDLEGIRSANAEPGCQGMGLCRVALRGARIKDGIEAHAAVFVAPPKRDKYIPYERRSRYAFDLTGAKAEGDVRLYPDCKVFGGVNMSGVKVTGSVQMHGAVVICEEVFALDFENAHIEGRVDLCSRRKPNGEIARFEVTGDVHMVHGRIDDSLNLYGTHIKGNLIAGYLKVGSDVDCQGLNGQRDGHPYTERFECEGDVILNGARLEGNLNLCGARIKGEVSAATCAISADFLAHPFSTAVDGVTFSFTLGKTLVLDGSHIEGNLNLTGAQLSGDVTANAIRIGSFCHLRSDPLNRFKCIGEIRLNLATIGLDLDMRGAVIEREIYAKNIRTGGNVLMRALKNVYNLDAPKDPFVALRRVTVSGAIITGDLDLEGAMLYEGIRCRGTQVNSALLLRLIEVPVANKELRPSIDLTNAHANVLIDGEGDGRNYSSSFRLALEGFTYGRFGQHGDAKSALRNDKKRDNALLDEKYEKEWTGRLRWLDRQYSNKSNTKLLRQEYRPDSYVQLYKVLKNYGYVLKANNVWVAKLQIERRIQNNSAISPLLFFYDVLFGFGLRPVRTIYVCLTYYLVVLGLVCYAGWQPTDTVTNSQAAVYSRQDTREALIITSAVNWAKSHSVEVLSKIGLRPDVLVVQQELTGKGHKSADPGHELGSLIDVSERPDTGRTTEVRCGRRIKPLLYAIEMIVPASQFNQRTKCDFSDTAGPVWSAVKAGAMLLGWIFSSIAILTLSNVIRRQSEPS